jgi:dihydroneopterin aldolase
MSAVRALTNRNASSSAVASPSTATMPDAIVLKDLSFFAKHGALAPERELGQKFTVNVELSVDLRCCGASDNLHDTVDYAKAWEIIRDVVERGETLTTIEAVAHRSALALLRAYPTVNRCVVEVDKPHVAIPGALGSLGVRIVRCQNDADYARSA